VLRVRPGPARSGRGRVSVPIRARVLVRDGGLTAVHNPALSQLAIDRQRRGWFPRKEARRNEAQLMPGVDRSPPSASENSSVHVSGSLPLWGAAFPRSSRTVRGEVRRSDAGRRSGDVGCFRREVPTTMRLVVMAALL
jgi:hypothetical protein